MAVRDEPKTEIKATHTISKQRYTNNHRKDKMWPYAITMPTEFSLVSATQAQHQVQGRLLLDVVVGERAAILQLLTGEDQALLLRRNALLVLDLGLHVLNRVVGLHVQRDGLAREGLDEDLHGTASQAKHQVQRRLLLDVVVREGAAVLELLAREDQTLLLGRDALLVLDLSLDILNRVVRLHVQRNGLARQGL